MERAGLLRIGSYESLAEYLWPEFIVFFKRTEPDLKLLIRTSSSMVHQKAFESGSLDVLVDAEPRSLGDVTSWVLYEDRFNFYALPGKVPQTLGPGSIGSLTLIFSPSAFDRENKSIQQHLEEEGSFFKEKMELDSFNAVRTFGEAGIGLVALPRRLAEKSLKSHRLSPVALRGFSSKGFGAHSICASTLSSGSDDNRIRLLVKALRENFKSA